MGKDRKRFKEQLQEVRSKNHNKLRYRRRLQQEEEAVKELKEYEDQRTKS
jgi:hypothetical protein